jgi:uncharacterized protein (DUF697 family)
VADEAQNSNSSPTTALEAIVDQTLRSVSDADATAASKRVAELRARQPGVATEQLVEQLIKQKAMQAGMIGAATSAAALIPGFGTVAAFTIGVATDVGMTLRLQAELVLEIAAAHGYAPSHRESRNALLLVTGVNMGAERLVNQASRKLAEKAAERLAGRFIVKAIPFFGIAISAGANILTTYAIGKRANAYFALGPDAVGDWDSTFRAITGVDERKLVGWLSDVMSTFGQMVGDRALQLRDATGNLLRRSAKGVQQRFQRRPSLDE